MSTGFDREGNSTLKELWWLSASSENLAHVEPCLPI